MIFIKNLKLTALLLCLFLVSTLFCGCKEKDNTILISLKSEDSISCVSSLSKQFEKSNGINIEFSENGGDIYEISNKDYLSGSFNTAVPISPYFYFLAANGKYSENLGNISSFEDLKYEVQALKKTEKIPYIFAFPTKEELTELLSVPVFEELSSNDDYDNPLLAAYNAKQLAFRYSDEAKEFLQFLKENTDRSATKENSLFFIARSDDTSLPEETEIIPVLAIEKNYGYLKISDKTSEEKKKLCEKFLEYNLKSNKNYETIKQSGIKIIPSLSPAFPEEFLSFSGKHLFNYLNGEENFESIRENLMQIWKSAREQNH